MNQFQNMRNSVSCRATLIAARACLALFIISVAVLTVLPETAPKWILSTLSALRLEGLCFGLVLYLAVFAMTLSSPTRWLAVLLTGSGILLVVFPLLGHRLVQPV